ncbi:hypothetical protein [Fulvitalea axinellae]|uniref:hypothetical protein n=1 Tax=Fulvitalea axinellae TaxID=1182444 RepID=UPI0030CA5519
MKEALQSSEKRCVGIVNDNYIVLKVPLEDRHFWSPQLSLTLTEDNGETLIKGRYGPKPSVWTLFAFGYAALGILTLFIGMYGLSTWSLGMDSSALWWIPALVGLAVLLYLSAQAGQKIGAEQMFTLHHFFEDATKTKINVN